MNDASIEQLLRAGQAAAAIKETAEGTQVAVLPPEYDIQDLEPVLAPYRATPRRIQQKLALHDVHSFVEYVTEYGSNTTKIFADRNIGSFRAIFDYHAPDAPHWKDHTATFTLRHTNEWLTWVQSTGQRMDQATFAEFLENNQLDITKPDGASVLEAARTLNVKRNVDFESSIRLSDGQVQFAYREANSEKGTVQLPEIITLTIRPYEGSAPHEINARIRYRINEQKLFFWYDLVRPHKVLESVIANTAVDIGTRTSRKILYGTV